MNFIEMDKPVGTLRLSSYHAIIISKAGKISQYYTLVSESMGYLTRFQMIGICDREMWG